MLITGGAGFIGCNAALYFINKGWDVTVFDNLSRAGTENNLEWLKTKGKFQFVKGDIRKSEELEAALSTHFDFVLHLAAQVAVTTSVTNPREDFELNALGTFNVLEAVKKTNKDAFVLFASTNKVYGKLEQLEVAEKNGRWDYKDFASGVDEEMNLDFHSPYGCSKGAADQYVIDYSRIYNMKTCVFRQSCIYGTRQFGIEDQGWVAWFTIASLLGEKLSIYGDGKQVRDVLYVEDLVRAYEAAFDNRDKVSGHAFNIGGGRNNVLSLLELVDLLDKKLNIKLAPIWADWRPGDQKVFICDISKIKKYTGWEPRTSASKGVEHLIDWVKDNEQMLRSVLKK